MSFRLINDLDVNVFNFKRFGKELPKQHQMSPHSFIQVAMQLAYYRSVMSSHPPLGGAAGTTKLKILKSDMKNGWWEWTSLTF